MIVVAAPHLPRRVTLAADTVLRQLLPRGGIDAAADLLGAGGGGGDLKVLRQPRFSTISFITYSAMGLRQMLPWQMNRILIVSIVRSS